MVYQRKVDNNFFPELLVLYGMYVISQRIIISIDNQLTHPIQFQTHPISWTFLMVHNKAKLKSNGNKASPCLDHFE
jgi:hypothetical protein